MKTKTIDICELANNLNNIQICDLLNHVGNRIHIFDYGQRNTGGGLFGFSHATINGSVIQINYCTGCEEDEA